MAGAASSVRCPAAKHRREQAVLNLYLHRLRDPRRQHAPALHEREITCRNVTREQRTPHNIRRCDRILNCEVDANAADRRHRVRRIADAQQPRFKPAPEAVDANGEKTNIVPREFAHAVTKERRERRNARTEGVDSPGMDRCEPRFGDHVRALPIVTTVEHRHEFAADDRAQRLRRIGGRRLMRIHSTSIGEPNVRAGSAVAARILECRWRAAAASMRSALLIDAGQATLARGESHPRALTRTGREPICSSGSHHRATDVKPAR